MPYHLERAGRYEDLVDSCSRVSEEPREQLVWDVDTEHPVKVCSLSGYWGWRPFTSMYSLS